MQCIVLEGEALSGMHDVFAQTALERQDSNRTYLAHHELESAVIIYYYYYYLQGTRTSAALMVANQTDPEGDLPGKGGSRGLYSLFWQFRGDMCAVRTDFKWVLLLYSLETMLIA